MDKRTKLYHYNFTFWLITIFISILIFNTLLRFAATRLNLDYLEYANALQVTRGNHRWLNNGFIVYLGITVASFISILLNRSFGIVRTDGKKWKIGDLYKQTDYLGLKVGMLKGISAFVVGIILFLLFFTGALSEYKEFYKGIEIILRAF